MTSFGSASLRLLRRLFPAGRRETHAPAGPKIVADGMTAVAAVEALISECASLGATWPGSIAARAWDSITHSDVGGTGVWPVSSSDSHFGAVRSATSADGPRAALATALGLAASGQRATYFASGPDLLAAQDLLIQAAGQHLPLVIHLSCRAPARQGIALGGGHEAYHALDAAGCVRLFAANAQEAADLALIARGIAEYALVPVIVAQDNEETATALQDIALPDAEFVRALLGAPWNIIAPPTHNQQMLYGKGRRRVPRRYDLDHPLLLNPQQNARSWGLAAAGQRAFAEPDVDAAIADAFEQFAALGGASYATLAEHETAGPDVVLITQGSATQTAIAAADHAHKHHKLRVGVIGIRCASPLPGPALANALTNAKTVAVLERIDAPLTADGPLTREIRTIFDRCRENARFGEEPHAGYPAIDDRKLPRLVSVPYGLGGLPLRGADLIALLDELKAPKRATVYLGIDFIQRSNYPKRQALMDSLRRDFPGLAERGLVGAEPTNLRPAGATTIAIAAQQARDANTLLTDAASVLHALFGGHLHGRPAQDGSGVPLLFEQCKSAACTFARLTHADAPLTGITDDSPIDLTVCIPPPATDTDAALAHEQRLGGLVTAFAKHTGRNLPTDAKLRAARETALTELSETDRNTHLDAFVAGAREGLPETPAPTAASAAATTTGGALVIHRTDQKLDALPRFWDQVGALHRDGKASELAPDPYLATGTVPPFSAALRGAQTPTVLPTFDPANCTGDGDLWTSCPDGSVAPIVISVRGLLDAGMDLAGQRGGHIDDLRPFASKLAKTAHKLIKDSDERGFTAAELFDAAFNVITEKSGAGDNANDALVAALDAVKAAIGPLPLSRTKPFFDDPETEESGAGHLLSLVINPDACQSPELLLQVGRDRGFVAADPTPENLERARRVWNLWPQLPDPSGKVIERARQHESVGPLAAVLLSRHCRGPMTPGAAGEPASGPALALRHTLALAEFHLQPRLQQHLDQLESLRGRLAEEIRNLLADALPTKDLDALADGLNALGRADTDLVALGGKVDQLVEQGQVDGARLGRLVDCARGLTDLQWRISDGQNHLGRSRFGLVLAADSGIASSATFPHNPFAAPTMLDATGHAGALARGLIEGHLRQLVAAIRLERWAQLELDRPKEAAFAAQDLERLSLDDLTDTERALCPPLLVVGDARTFGGQGLSQLVWLLSTRLPIRVLVLNELGGPADVGHGVDALAPYPSTERSDLGLLALLGRSAFVAQTSIGKPSHFADSVLRALAFEGPAIIHVHAPSPTRHGFAAERLFKQACRAVRSRAFPVFTFDPSGAGVFGSCIDLAGNPNVDESFGTNCHGMRLTPLDWALGEARFRDRCPPLTDEMPNPTPVMDYFDLPRRERAGRTPVVESGCCGEQAVRLAVAPALIDDAERRLRFWRTLQELAGVVTPFTEQVRADAESAVAESHERELADLRAELEAQMRDQESTQTARMTERVTARLMMLAGYDKANGANEEAGR